MKKAVPNRQYTKEFREAAVRQVIDGGRPIRQVALSLEMSAGTLGNWVMSARQGQPITSRPSSAPIGELEAVVSRLRQEVARLKIEKEFLNKAAAYFAKESM